uniref:hypothetical protein n=1 Tax=Pararhizobium sp. IMCC3301 TaxID=3067904 RepID=UPI0027404F4A|nr:hypothetical protein [Pararhizobium sp. IMCC3301]
MLKLVRILVIALIASFAAGSVVQATSTSTMAVKMALAEGGTMDAANCTNCDADGNGAEDGLSCVFACIVPLIADLGTQPILSAPLAASTAAAKGAYGFVGRTAQPEPHPPRTLI